MTHDWLQTTRLVSSTRDPAKPYHRSNRPLKHSQEGPQVGLSSSKKTVMPYHSVPLLVRPSGSSVRGARSLLALPVRRRYMNKRQPERVRCAKWSCKGRPCTCWSVKPLCTMVKLFSYTGGLRFRLPREEQRNTSFFVSCLVISRVQPPFTSSAIHACSSSCNPSPCKFIIGLFLAYCISRWLLSAS